MNHVCSSEFIVLGAGRRGSYWIDQILKSRFSLVAVVDSVEGALSQAKARFDLPTSVCFTDFAAALSACPGANVINVTPGPLHMETSLQAIEARRNVLVEKPMATNMDEAWSMVRAADHARVTLMAAQNWRFSATHRTIRHMTHSGSMGKFGFGVMIAYRKRPAGGTYQAKMDYPCLMEDSVHWIDSLLSFVPERPVLVTSRNYSAPWSDYAGGASDTVIIEFESGAHVSYVSTWVGQSDALALRLECERGVLGWGAGPIVPGADSTDLRDVYVLKNNVQQERPEVGAIRPLQPARHVLDVFVDAVSSGIEPETSGRQNLTTLAVLLAAARSAEEKRSVRIEEVIKGADVFPSVDERLG